MTERRNVTAVPWVTFDLPEDVHRRARAEASLSGKKLYPYLIEKIAEGVERDERARREREREER